NGQSKKAKVYSIQQLAGIYAPCSFLLPFTFDLDTLPLARRLEKHDSRGDRDVQTFDGAVHRNRYQAVATLLYQAPATSTFRAENHGSWQREVDRVVRLGRPARESEAPHAKLLQFLDRTRDV